MFEFTEEDLKANKRGQLSASQREWLKMCGTGGVRRKLFLVWRSRSSQDLRFSGCA